MNAGYVGLTEVYTPERSRALNDFGDGLRERFNAVVRRRGLAMQFTGLGSMIGVHMTDAPIRSEADALQGNAEMLDLFYFDLLARGIWFAKRGMMALSIALDQAEADKLVAAVEDFCDTERAVRGSPSMSARNSPCDNRAPLCSEGAHAMSYSRQSPRCLFQRKDCA